MRKIGFLGLGIMGTGMCKRLLGAGYHLTVYNRTPGKARELISLGAIEARTPSETVSQCDVSITMLGDPASVKEVILEKGGVLEGIRRGAYHVDMTTIDPNTSKRLWHAFYQKGAHFLEAPVTGSKLAAARGELVLMVGGEKDDLETLLPVLTPLSKKIVHMGEVGKGAMMKLVNNLSMAGAMEAFFEGFTLGRKAGLSPERILEVLNQSALASPLLKMKGEAALNRDFETHFSLKHMAKDIRLAVVEARRLEVPLPVTLVVDGLFDFARSQGLDEFDFASLVQVVEQMAQLKT
ncbi:MAG: NAD(P)-dependent oxidoreductase [Nitrospirae bacterium]|nr:NAD(P)-dependent oxidoreductase [Nitrospirota bacterium]MBI3595214.1 NAD(P)-dependent oxidoreductase [Nitrospirota bacterium]